MNLSNLARLSVIAVVFLAAGCSENKGKIEGTKWSSQATNADGMTLPAGAMTIEFKTDGKLVWTIVGQNFTGKYTLGMGKKITFDMDQAMSGNKKLQSNFTIEGNSLTMRDNDGKTIMFTKAN